MSIGERTQRRLLPAAFAIVSVLLAARLFIPAMALAFSRRSIEEFNTTGLPGWTRLALALPEMIGAVLLAIPRTFYLGILLLILDLGGAITAHLCIGIQPYGLCLLIVAVLSLALARRSLMPRKSRQ
jgi:hypothetical protein